MSAVGWLRYSLALAPLVNSVVRDLYALTRGDVALSKTVIHRIRDRGYLLDEARREVDATLEALERAQREKDPPPGGAS